MILRRTCPSGGRSSPHGVACAVQRPSLVATCQGCASMSSAAAGRTGPACLAGIVALQREATGERGYVWQQSANHTAWLNPRLLAAPLPLPRPA